MTTEIAATKEGKVTGLRVHVLADHGAFDACADPSKWPAGFFNIVTGSYDFPTAHLSVDGIYTNKAPGGVAYRCSFRVTEAAYCIERGMDILAQKLKMDPAELRLKNFIKAEQFPYHSALGWEYDSGDYHTAMKKMMEAVDYAGLRKQQAAQREAFKRGETREIMGCLLYTSARAVIGTSLDAATLKKAAAAAEAIMSPAADARGPVEYRKHVGGIMVTRALQRAASRAS